MNNNKNNFSISKSITWDNKIKDKKKNQYEIQVKYYYPNNINKKNSIQVISLL